MHQSLQRDLLLVSKAGHPLERLLEAYIVAQLDVITVLVGIDHEGLNSTVFPRIRNVAKIG